METFEGRLNSFSKSKLSKSSSSKASANRTWPHPESYPTNPKSLAEAGFFFKPGKGDPDNVQCFICAKELGGWDEEDNPFEIHVRKCPKCPWAIARCSLEFDVDGDGNFALNDTARLPTNKALEKARLDTYGGKRKWWPHDSNKDHGATSRKMAKAGFVYTPQTSGDDTATCFYCDLSLSGWDEDDDPIEEHRKRDAKSDIPCPFFHAEVQTATKSGEEEKLKAASRKSRAPKEKAPVVEESEGDETSLPPASKHDGEKSGSKPASRKSRAPKERAAVVGGSEEEEASAPPKPPGKKSKPSSVGTVAAASTRKKSVKPHPVQDDGSEEVDAPKTARKSVKKPAKGKPTPNFKTRTEAPSEAESADVTEPKPTLSQAEVAHKPSSNIDGKVTKSYEEFTVDINEMETAQRTKGVIATTARKSSRSQSKPRSVEGSARPPSSRSQSRTHSRSVSKSKVVEVEDTEMEELVDVEPLCKSRRQTQAKKTAPESEVDEPIREPPSKKIEPTARPQASEFRPPSTVSEKAPASKSTGKRVVGKSSKKTAKGSAPASSSTLDSSHQAADDFADGVPGEVSGEFTEATTAQMDVDEDITLPVVEETPMPKQPSSSKARNGGDPQPHQPSKVTPHPAEPTPIETQDVPPTLSKSKGRDSGPKGRDASQSGVAMDVDDSRADTTVTNMSAPAPLLAAAEITSAHEVLQPRATPPPPQNRVPDLEQDEVTTGQGDGVAEEADTTTTQPTTPLSLFVPPLAIAPLVYASKLTDAERAMTVEQWIRHEMELQYAQLRCDGERAIDAFRRSAEEVRARIEAL